MTLADFIDDPLDQDDPDIQMKITKKKEFNEFASKRSEPVPEKGQLYPQQECTVRQAIALRKPIVCIHLAGAGKTCIMAALAEYEKHNTPECKGVYIMEKGPATIDGIKNEIICKCVPDVYETKAIRMAKDTRSKKNNITREIGKWYKIVTYGTVAIKVANCINDIELKKEFGGITFFIDEVHNITAGSFVKTKKRKINIYEEISKLFNILDPFRMLFSATPIVNFTYELIPLLNLINPEYMQLPSPDKSWNFNKMTYNMLEPYMRGRFSYVRNLDTSIIQQSMGTEINFIYDIERPDPDKIDEWEKKILSKYVDEYGLIKSFDVEQPIPPMKTYKIKSELTLYFSFMSEHQKKGYRLALSHDRYGNVMGKKVKTDFRLDERQAAAGVFPDLSHGGIFPRQKQKKEDDSKRTDIGLSKYVDSPKNGEYKVIINVKNGEESLKPYLSDISKLKDLSCKFATIAQVEINAMKQKIGYKGCSFIFSDFFTGFGAILLGLVLSNNGFERYEPSSSEFTNEGGKLSICDTTNTRVLKSGFGKKARFAYLTSENSKNGVLIRELFNSDINVDGEYLQIIIGSEVARDGINISHILRGHMFNPDWNHSSSYQALNRFIRSTSHITIREKRINILRNQLELAGWDEEAIETEIANYKVIVQIYKHAAVYWEEFTPLDEASEYLIKLSKKQPYNFIEGDMDKYDKKGNFIKKVRGIYSCGLDDTMSVNSSESNSVEYWKPIESVDLDLYIYSERKDIENKYITRFMKQVSNDAFIHLKRNIREEDIDYSYDADYNIAEYMDRSKLPVEIDFSSYDLLYYHKIVDKCIEDIKKYIKIKSIINIKELKNIWKYPESEKYFPRLEDPEGTVFFQFKGEKRNIYYREIIIDKAIDKILLDKIPVSDRFGFLYYLYTDSINIYRQRDLPLSISKSNSELSIYNNIIIVTKKGDFNKYVENVTIDINEHYISELEDIDNPIDQFIKGKLNDDFVRFNDIVNKLSSKTKCKLVEKAIVDEINFNNKIEKDIIKKELKGSKASKYRENALDDKVDKIGKISYALLKKYKNYIFSVNELIKDINIISSTLATTKNKNDKIDELKTNINEDNEIIYGHTVMNVEKSMRGGAELYSKFKNVTAPIRLYKPSDKSWYEVNIGEAEFYAYRNYYVNKINERANELNKNDYWGIIINDKFYIHSKTEETKIAKHGGKDARSDKIKGCSSFDKIKLYQILMEQEYIPKKFENYADEDLKTTRIRTIEKFKTTGYEGDLDNYDDDDLKLLDKWFNSGYDREQLCEMIQKSFNKNDLIF